MLIPLGFEIDGRTLSWFSTLATIGTPLDVTLDDLVIETLFPADDATERAVRARSDTRPDLWHTSGSVPVPRPR